MALELNGTTGVSLVQDGVVTAADLASGSVSADKLSSTLDLTGKTVTLPAGVGGKVLQVVSATKTDATTISTSTSFQDISGLSVSITPSSTSSKIMVFVSIAFGTDSNTYGVLRLLRNSTAISLGNSSGSRITGTSTISGTNISRPFFTGLSFLDSPSTTSSTTYKCQIRVPVNGLKINTSWEDEDNTSTGMRLTSTITVMEIGS